MAKPPGLKGTLFTEEEKEIARRENKLLFVSLMTDPVCNLACPDCYVGEKKITGKELSLAERKKVIDQAVELGAKTLRIAGAGEPLIDKNFWDTTNYAIQKGLHVFLFTNGTEINDDRRARAIVQNKGITAVLKFSGKPEIMDLLTGNKGYFLEEKFVECDGMFIPKYLVLLIEAGMNAKSTGGSRLGIEFLLRKSNYGYCTDIFRWARHNNIVPYVEQNLEAGLALSNNWYLEERVADSDAFALSRRLSEIDEKEFGFKWKPGLPYMVGGICENEVSGCKKYTYNIVVQADGTCTPCYAAYFNLGNVRDRPLKEILRHPIRRQLLEAAEINCLCRVYNRTWPEPKTPEELDQEKDYQPNTW